MLDTDKIIVLENGEEYLILDKVLNKDKEYYYIARINETETDIENNYKLVTIDEKDGDKIIVEIVGEDRLKALLPLFAREM